MLFEGRFDNHEEPLVWFMLLKRGILLMVIIKSKEFYSESLFFLQKQVIFN